MSRQLNLAALALMFAAGACTDQSEPTGVLGVSASVDNGVEGSALDGAKPLGPIAEIAASGLADVQGTPVQNVRDERYAFTALSTGVFPLGKGQVEVHLLRFTGEVNTVHAEVTCLSVVGNQAWVGSRVTRFLSDGEEVPARIGGPMIFRVVDVGEGEDATDLASLVFFPPPGGDIAHCSTRPEFPILRESTVGNIQVNAE